MKRNKHIQTSQLKNCPYGTQRAAKIEINTLKELNTFLLKFNN